MRAPQSVELVFGSVQLGLSYGAANRIGLPPRPVALQLVRHAADAGITIFDTARAYGESEDRLGEALRVYRAARAITKLSPLTELAHDAPPELVRRAVDTSIDQSLAALKRDRIDCLLLHRAAHMTAYGGAIWQRLIEHLEDGTVRALGVSVQSPKEALAALESSRVQHIQLPFNFLDKRWAEAGVIDRIQTCPHVTIHVRSVFLQGVLAASDPAVWPAVLGVDSRALMDLITHLVVEFGRESTADLCLAYARGQSWVDGVVVGMETEEQLYANLGLFRRPPLTPQECTRLDAQIPDLPAALLDPAQWPRKT